MSDTKTLEQRMIRLQGALDEALNSAGKRKSNSLIIMVIALIALSFYLMIAYFKVAEFDAKTVVLSLESYTRQQIDASRPELTRQLIAYAPKATDQLEALIRKAPEELTIQLRSSILQIVTQALPDLEAQLHKQVTAALDEAYASMPKAENGQVDEEVFRKAMDEMAIVYGQEVQKMIDQVHKLYVKRSHEILSGLDHIARGQQLTPAQAHLRDALVSFLQLMEHWEPAQPNLPTE
ncbi:MAG: hypothetical protein ACF8OB_14875 [Phycisphaeraceae bacterium JB051]